MNEPQANFDRIYIQIARVPAGYPSDHPFLIRKWSMEAFDGGVEYLSAARSAIGHASSVEPSQLVKNLCEAHSGMFARLHHNSGVSTLHANEVSSIASLILDAAIVIDRQSHKRAGREPTEHEKDRARDAVKAVLERHGYDIPTVADLCGIAAIRTILNPKHPISEQERPSDVI